MQKERFSRRPIALVAEASAEEIAAFRQVCAAESYPIAPEHESGYLRVLLTGSRMAEAARRRTRELGGIFTLLVSHDESVLHDRELLEHCANILVAPFDTELLASTVRSLGEDTRLDPGSYENIIGRSPQIQELLRVMSILSQYDAPVLIRGETGTGKELIARGIHYSSTRCDRAFVPVNCAALNDELLIAELFGYEKGAFTDAKRAHRGLVEQAAGGALFLDELDSLSPRAQAALLRFLQEQEYRPLGSQSVLKSDVRIITATNKDLLSLVAEGRFREDLYYRVQMLDVFVPPLRTRVGDLDVLAEHFLERLSERYGTPPKRLHSMTRQWMSVYSWPGNVRELQNFLFRVFVLTSGSTIFVPRVKGNPIAMHGTAGQEVLAEAAESIGTCKAEMATSTGPAPRIAEDALQSFSREKIRALQQFERNYLQQVMKVAGGNVSNAARRAGKERRAFRRLLKKYGIDRQNYAE